MYKSKVNKISYISCNNLKKISKESDLRRSRICLHDNNDDPIQEMIIHFCEDSYIRPHKHKNKSESYLILDGLLDLIYFDDKGNIIERHELSKYDKLKKNNVFYVRTKNQLYHTLLIKSKYAIILEITNGPYNKTSSIFAKWAPNNGHKSKVIKFLNSLK